MLQKTEWREAYDWIHRDSDGKLQSPLIAFRFCSTRNIREQNDCLAFSVIGFFDKAIKPNLEKMRQIHPDAEMLSTSLKTQTEKSLNGLRQHNQTFWMFKQIYNIFYKLTSEVCHLKL